MIKISESTVVEASIDNVFEKLINPQEQLKWNTLYLEVNTAPKGPISNGTVMTGKFKGSGSATVLFENVIPNQEFTHYSRLKIVKFVYLGEFRHKYKLEDFDGKTKITQTVFFTPKGIGKLLQRRIVNGFKDRIPVSFDEFKNYIDLKQ